jgi:serine/threonine-protein kinase
MVASRPPPWNPTANEEEVRAQLQDRLRLFSLVVFWIFVILMAVTFALYSLYPETKVPGRFIPDAFAITGLAALGGAWLVMRTRQFSVAVLYLMDLLCSINVGIGFGLSAYYRHASRTQVYGAFIWLSYMIFMRAIILPSTGKRTAIVSLLGFVPLFIVGIVTAIQFPDELELQRPAFLFVLGLSSATAIVLATTGSRVIYGLRRQVREARTLGVYTLEDIIGQGGMGTVYRANHHLLRRPAAIKLLPPEKHGVENIARFWKEVHAMSRLTHPNTVAIYDYGYSTEGQFYYAMELLDGVNLEALVKRDGPQPAPRVIRILRQVCGALDEAHGIGLTHRDIKPGNIILCRRGSVPDVAKVVDFGLVQEHRDGASHILAGTPQYLAPEAVTDPSKVGPASDLYSLGCVAYFLLTGKRVFDADKAVDWMVLHSTRQPVPPSQVTENPISPALEQLVLACLAKNPAERPVSAAALRLALKHLPEAQDWDEEAARRWWDAFDVRKTEISGHDLTIPRTITIDGTARTVEMPRSVRP